MNYEKEYTSLVGKIKKAHLYAQTDSVRAVLEDIYPQLAESEDERIRKAILEHFEAFSPIKLFGKRGTFTRDQVLAYLEKQKENPKTADSIPSNCVSDAKCEDRWYKVKDFLPDSGRDVLAKDALGNYLLASYNGDQWFISVYDDEDKPIVYTPAIVEWMDIPSEKQKEPHYTKRNALFDKCVENCDPKTVEEVNKRVDDIMNMSELSAFEQALTNFIGYWEDDEEHWPSQFVKKHGKHILDMAREELEKEQKPEHFELKAGKWYICHRAFCCRADHLTVKEGERFQCEKDGIVKGFVIKEPEKYFKECSAPAPMEDEQKEQKLVESEGDLTDFENNINHLLADKCEIYYNENLGGCYDLKGLCNTILKLAYNELQSELKNDLFEAKQEGRQEGYEAAKKEQKPLKVGENAYFDPNTEMWFIKKEQKPYEPHNWPTDKDNLTQEQKPVELTGELSTNDSSNSSGLVARNLTPEQIREETLKPVEWSDEDKEMLLSIINACRNGIVSTIGQEQWLKSLPERFNLQPKQEWSEEDKKTIDAAYCWLCEYAGSLIQRNYGKSSMLYGIANKLKSLRPQKLDASKLENFDPVEVLNKIKKEWPMAWEKVVGKQEWSEEDDENFKWFDKFFRAESVITGGRDIPQDKYLWFKSLRPSWKPSEEDLMMLEHIIGQYEIGNKNCKTTGYLPRVEELNFLKKILDVWKN